MGVVSGARLHRFMSEPRWSAAQAEVADLLCEAVETTLEDALCATFISPRPWVETARILTDGGLVDTGYPVHRVTRIDDGPTIAEGDPLPDGWRFAAHHLYRTSTGLGGATTTVTPESGLLYPFAGVTALGSVTPRYDGAVHLAYDAGWGAQPTLVLAILRKAQVLMANRHDDTMTARGLDATKPPKLGEETWTKDELAQLGRYRRLGIGGR